MAARRLRSLRAPVGNVYADFGFTPFELFECALCGGSEVDCMDVTGCTLVGLSVPVSAYCPVAGLVGLCPRCMGLLGRPKGFMYDVPYDVFKGEEYCNFAYYRGAELVREYKTWTPPPMIQPVDGVANLLATGPDRLRDGKQAVEHATRACELTAWKTPAYLATLAAASAEAGDFDKAREYQTKALSFPDYAKTSGPEGRRRLELYERKKPYRDPAFAIPELAPLPRPMKP